MATLKLSTQELETQTLEAETLRLATQLVQVDGYVVFERVLPPDFIAGLRQSFLKVFEAHLARTESNRGNNRYQMHLPFQAPFNHESIICNPLVLALIDDLLGKDAVCHYFASDTPLPGSDYQQVHSDIHLLFPETSLSLPAYSIVLNIPLVDFREDNGPVEIWPGGTHLMPGSHNLKELARHLHSETVLMPAGSLLIRDMRMWHRGTPNRSQEPRPNLALIYSRPWLKTHYPPIAIPTETYEALSERARHLFRFENKGAPVGTASF